MKEKFVRSSKHTSISEFMEKYSSELTKESLELVRAVAEDLKKFSDTNSEQAIGFENIQMADSSEYSDITINNAHKYR